MCVLGGGKGVFWEWVVVVGLFISLSLSLSLYLVLLFMDLWRIGKSLACVVDHPSGGLQMGEGNNNK
jgi:TM2 domain-containing membrane protein YozV